jgi:hypothetical protein
MFSLGAAVADPETLLQTSLADVDIPDKTARADSGTAHTASEDGHARLPADCADTSDLAHISAIYSSAFCD